MENGLPEITSVFQLFFIYWDVCSKRGAEYTAGQVLSITDNIFEILRSFWIQEGWDINELRTATGLELTTT